MNYNHNNFPICTDCKYWDQFIPRDGYYLDGWCILNKENKLESESCNKFKPMNKVKKTRVCITLDPEVMQYVKDSGICLSYTINNYLKIESIKFNLKQTKLDL